MKSFFNVMCFEINWIFNEIIKQLMHTGTGDSMADDDDNDEAMAQWYALVKKRNELVREESMMIYK